MADSAIVTGFPWPEDFAEHEISVKSQWKVAELRLHKQLTGKSGALVYLTHVISADYSGYAILKLEKESARVSRPRETELLVKARANSAQYTKHLPDVLHDYSSGPTTISLFSIAGDGLEYVFPLAQLDAGADLTVGMVAKGLVNWSAACYRVTEEPASAQTLLKAWLGYRIMPGNGGRLHDLLKQCGANPDSQGLSAAGTVYPNPLAFCLGNSSATDLYPLLGQQHGDCHGNNILVKKDYEQANPDFYLIDFALYEPSWPLFYDQAYLELSLLLGYGGSFDSSRWDAFLTFCGKRPAAAQMSLLRSEDKGFAPIVRRLRDAVKDLMERNRSIKGSVESQQRLARVAAGLNFANKLALSVPHRYKALVYAAHQLKEYFHFKGLATPESGQALLDPVERSNGAIGTGDWREVWRQCSEFQSGYVYVLVAGAGLRGAIDTMTALARLPWALVLDIDPDSNSVGLFAALRETIKKRRGLHYFTSDQYIDVNFGEGTAWLMACGMKEKPDTIVSDFNSWRYGKIRELDRHLVKLHQHIAPRQLRVLFLHAHQSERPYFVTLGQRILEVFHGSRPKLIVSHDHHLAPLEISEQNVNIACSPRRLAEGLANYLGPDAGVGLVYLPRRIEEQTTSELKIELHGFDAADIMDISEDLEIVHPGLESDDKANPPIDGFLRGNTITWMELARAFDVQLDIYPDLRRTIMGKLAQYTNETLELGHEPGGGGSTVARRLAWDLHREFPCVVLRQHSDYTSRRIASLYRMTHLPVLVIIEAATITVPERDRLFKAVRGENARSIFLYVVRVYNSSRKHQVRSPLSEVESKSFLRKYAQSDTKRMENLERLAFSAEMLPYRMPFFFGLYAFEENFTHIEAYVRSHVQELSTKSLTLLRQLAMVSRFSQCPVDISIIVAIAKLTDDPDAFSIETILGKSATRLVIQDVHRGQLRLRIVHPLIAEHILRIDKDDARLADKWKSDLEVLSCDFIASLAETCGRDAEAVQHLLEQLYVQRETLVSGHRDDFAQIILAIPSSHAQARVLEELTKNFPENAHFWNHRGRHSNLILREGYRQAETFLLKAIQLQPNDPLHYHSLGMVYRFEIERLLKKKSHGASSTKASLELVRRDIYELFTLADDAFAKTRELDNDSEYGYVSEVQLIFSTIESMRKMSGDQEYATFFQAKTPTMAWLRSKLEKAKELLDYLVGFQGEGASRYAQYVAQYRGLMGDYRAMVQGLSDLLKAHGEEAPMLRRLVSDCIRSHHQDRWETLDASDLGRIRDLANDNIRSGVATRRDFINWLQAYRRLAGFNFNEAISTMDRWEMKSDAIEAHYYRFVLHFLKWYRNLTTDLSLAINQLTKLKSQSGHTWAYEWLAKPEQSNGCGIIRSEELGTWQQGNDGHKFYDRIDALERISGVVTLISDARSGKISIYSTATDSTSRRSKIEAFFVPGTDFVSGRDENTPVTAYLAFSYAGLRAWKVKRVS